MADRRSATVSFAQFSALARRIGDQARGLGLAVPAFRTPPKVGGVDRTLRRGTDGGAIIAVRLSERGVADVVADLVEGVIATNRLSGDDAIRARSAILAAIPKGERWRAA